MVTAGIEQHSSNGIGSSALVKFSMRSIVPLVLLTSLIINCRKNMCLLHNRDHVWIFGVGDKQLALRIDRQGTV